MTIRTKLFIYFFILSMLTFAVGMTSYVQLRNLIDPLTPQSIPRSVDKMNEVIERNKFVSRIAYQQLLVDYALDRLVYRHTPQSLQDYYLNESMLDKLLSSANKTVPVLWKKLEGSFKSANDMRTNIITMVANGNLEQAKMMMDYGAYPTLLESISNTLKPYYEVNDLIQVEDSVVTVKMATNNTRSILQNSLQTTLIIFFDAIVISLALAFFSARTISRPMNLLRNNIERMSVEDLSVPISNELLQLTGEIGDLARSFDTLINKLRATTVLRDELLVEVERRKSSEDQLRETALNLEESNRELDQFAYAASHDLRSPLRGIANLVNWIEEDCHDILPLNSRNQFELLKKRVNRLDALINGILEYSRIGRVYTNMEQVDLSSLMIEVIDNLAPPPRVVVTVDNNLPQVIANRVSIMQVFMNLIGNAIKYHDKPKGNIHIGSRVMKTEYEFYVADDGPGIDPQFHEKIFVIFQSLQPRDVIEGSGIGLAIVKKIVERQGGKIWLTSVMGKGTTFYFTWPKDVEKHQAK